MNVMTDIWTEFSRDRSQNISVSYRYSFDADAVLRRREGADGETTYAMSPCPADVEWYGGEGIPPWVDEGIQMRWVDIDPAQVAKMIE